MLRTYTLTYTTAPQQPEPEPVTPTQTATSVKGLPLNVQIAPDKPTGHICIKFALLDNTMRSSYLPGTFMGILGGLCLFGEARQFDLPAEEVKRLQAWAAEQLPIVEKAALPPTQTDHTRIKVWDVSDALETAARFELATGYTVIDYFPGTVQHDIGWAERERRVRERIAADVELYRNHYTAI